MMVPSENKALLRPCTLVYLALVFLTAVTWAVGRAGLGGLGLSLTVLGFALFKGQLLGDWFMGLRGVRGVWRAVVTIWLMLAGGLIAVAFILSSGG